MANHKGSEGVVHVGTTAVAELTGWEVQEAANPINDTILSDTWETNKVGNLNWRGSAKCWWDETDTNGQEVLDIGSEVTLKFYMEGTASGSTYKTGSAIVTGVVGAGAINGICSRDFDFLGNGVLSQTTV